MIWNPFEKLFLKQRKVYFIHIFIPIFLLYWNLSSCHSIETDAKFGFFTIRSDDTRSLVKNYDVDQTESFGGEKMSNSVDSLSRKSRQISAATALSKNTSDVISNKQENKTTVVVEKGKKSCLLDKASDCVENAECIRLEANSTALTGYCKCLIAYQWNNATQKCDKLSDEKSNNVSTVIPYKHDILKVGVKNKTIILPKGKKYYEEQFKMSAYVIGGKLIISV